MNRYEEALRSIPHQPQQQCSTADQTMALMIILERIGLHGALTYLQSKDASRYSTKALDEVVDEKAVDALGNLPALEGLGLEHELGQARRVATRFGLYDAADLVRLYVENLEPETASLPSPGR